MKKVKIIHWGIGAMGGEMVKLVQKKSGLESVAAICRAYPASKDLAKVKAGKDLGEVAGLGRPLAIALSDNADEVLSTTRADIVLHSTSSSLEEVEEQIIKAVTAGLNVITTSQSKLVFPWKHYPEIGRRIDEAAKKKGVTVLFTGVNPGFIMDFIPITFTGICASVRSIRVRRVVNYAPFGPGSVTDSGFGLPIEEFKKKIGEGAIPLIAPSSPCIDMIADALGWNLEETQMTIEPLTSKKPKTVSYMEIKPGLVCGFRRIFCGMKNGEAVIILDTIGMVDPEEDGFETGDALFIEGEPNVDLVIKGEIAQKAGMATVAHAVNSIPQVMEAKPGLVTVRDLPVAAAIT
jgi:hypothetical protein